MTESLVKLHNVTKFYPTPRGKKMILDNISFEIPKENIAVLGPNGAGKSTFFRLLGGVEYPNKGEIITKGSMSWPIGLSGGFQPSLTGRQNAFFVCSIYCSDKSDVQKKIDFVEEFAELGSFFDMPIKQYSSGMRSRLGFGLSLAFDFDVYLVDEVTSVGDANFRKKAQQAFAKIYEKATVLMVSHDMNTLRTNCKSAILLNNGKLKYTTDINAAIEMYLKGNYND